MTGNLKVSKELKDNPPRNKAEAVNPPAITDIKEKRQKTHTIFNLFNQHIFLNACVAINHLLALDREICNMFLARSL
jgi:hypothetical protein